MNRTYGLARTGSYLTTASMLVMMGRNDQNVMANPGLNTVKKDITSPFGCRIVDIVPSVPRSRTNWPVKSEKERPSW